MNSMVKNAADVREVIESTFPQEVQKFRLTGPDNMQTPHWGLWYGDACLSTSVKDGYTMHTRDDVSALCEAAIRAWGTKHEARMTCAWREGHCISIAPSKAKRLEVFDGDAIWPRVLIRAGYEGNAFSASVAFYRDLCKNLAMPQEVSSVVRVRIRHTSSLRPKMEDLIAKFQSLGKGWGEIKTWTERMKEKKVKLNEFLREVYPLDKDASKRTRTTHNDRIEKIMVRVMREREQLGLGSLGRSWMVSGWEAYNAVQGFVQHDKRRRGEPGRFDRALLSLEESELARAERIVLAV